jgi:antitoxin component YwqK of YwqJK toxin-antitoxin module
MKLLIIFFTITIIYGCNKLVEIEVKQCNSEDLYLIIDKQDSIYKMYNDNKYRYSIGKIINCNKEGIWEEYITDENRLDFKWTYKNNKRNGIYYGYTITGKIETVGYYTDDKLDGVLVYYNLNNKIEKIEHWAPIKGIAGTSKLTYRKMINTK